jgi:excisionase family DNA binding protein
MDTTALNEGCYLDVDQAAELLGHRPETVLRMVHSGTLPIAARLSRHGLLIWRDAVNRLSSEQKSSAPRNDSPLTGTVLRGT